MADDLLANFRPSPFQNTGNDPGGAFGELGGGINPAGFASNVDNETADVIIDKDGITVIEGAITVTNAGATVIIDGSSNMFKIASTGTRSFAGPNGSPAETTSTVDVATGFDYTPAFQVYLTNSAGVQGSAWHTGHADVGATALFTQWRYAEASYLATNQTRMRFFWFGFGDYSAVTSYFRYYILQEAGI